MRRIVQWVAYPPNMFILISAVAVIIGLCFSLFATPMDLLLRTVDSLPPEVADQRDEDHPIDNLVRWMSYGRPWIALLVGVVGGLLVYSWRVRFLERNFEKMVIESSTRVLTGERANLFPRGKTVLVPLLAPLLLLSISGLFHMSMQMVYSGLAGAIVIMYPVHCRQFDAIVTKLVDPLLEPDQADRGRRWIRSQRRNSAIAACAITASAICMVIFTASSLEMLSEVNQDVLDFVELTTRSASEEDLTSPAGPN